MQPPTTSFNDENSTTRETRYSSGVYPPPQYYGGGYPSEVYPPPPVYYGGGYPPTGYGLPQLMAGYGGQPSPPPSYGMYPWPYNPGPYPPQAYGHPHYAPPVPAAVHGFAPPRENSVRKIKKKSKIGKMLGLAGGVAGGLLLGDFSAGGSAAMSSFESFSDPTGGYDQLYNASMQSVFDSMDLVGYFG